MKYGNCNSVKLLILSVIVFLLLTPCSAKTIRVACVGDSNTYGFGLSRQDAYPAQLEVILQQYSAEWEVKNFGHNGATVLRYGDLYYRNQSVYQQAISYKPNVVIFNFNGNASRSLNRGYIQEYFLADYLSLVQEFAALDSAPELWISLPLGAYSNMWTINPGIIRDEMMPLITQVAEEMNIPVIDFYSAFKDAPHLYQGDKIHPTTEGAKLMAEMVASMILDMRFLPDFNDDYKVDIKDLILLIEHWGQNAPSFDVVPVPFGDGLVDAADLEALMSYWGQELYDPHLLAQWKLDETEGMFAADSIGENNGIVFGNPTWQPDDGQANGALEFDGIDDMIIVKSVLNPEDGPFSVFAWIKGDAPGQTIVSQQNGVNWLQVDTDGTLMTELTKSGGRITGVPLYSETVIMDGNWHRVGFVWDGSDRILYVDDVEVAHDTLGGLTGSDSGLYIGTGNSSEAGTFWSGMIDDVRIYDRTVTP